MGIHVGIGALTKRDILQLLADGHEVIRYDPRKGQDYGISMPRYTHHAQAVIWTDSPIAVLSSEGVGSTIATNKALGLRVDCNDVEAINIRDVLSGLPEIECLHLDCEGSEFHLLMVAQLELLSRCKELKVEFHSFSDAIRFDRHEVNVIIERLKRVFDHEITNARRPDITFTRIEQ